MLEKAHIAEKAADEQEEMLCEAEERKERLQQQLQRAVKSSKVNTLYSDAIGSTKCAPTRVRVPNNMLACNANNTTHDKASYSKKTASDKAGASHKKSLLRADAWEDDQLCCFQQCNESTVTRPAEVGGHLVFDSEDPAFSNPWIVFIIPICESCNGAARDYRQSEQFWPLRRCYGLRRMVTWEMLQFRISTILESKD